MFYFNKSDPWMKTFLTTLDFNSNAMIALQKLFELLLTKNLDPIEVPFASISAAGVTFNEPTEMHTDHHVFRLNDGLGDVYTRLVKITDNEYSFTENVDNLNMSNTKMYVPQANWDLIVDGGNYTFTHQTYKSTITLYSDRRIGITRSNGSNIEGDGGKHRSQMNHGLWIKYSDDVLLTFYQVTRWVASEYDVFMMSNSSDITTFINNVQAGGVPTIKAFDSLGGYFGNPTCGFDAVDNNGTRTFAISPLVYHEMFENNIVRLYGTDVSTSHQVHRNLTGTDDYWVFGKYSNQNNRNFYYRVNYEEFLNELNQI